MKYFKKMVGEKCYLSPISLDDAEIFTSWLNDIEVTKNLTLAHDCISLNSEKELLPKLADSHNYSIIDLEKDEIIGNCGLMDMNNYNRTAEIGIFIGDKRYWSRGYGNEAMSLLLDYSFQYLNLRNIMLRVYSFNERAIACYKNVGFKEIGKWRNALQRNMKEYDIIFMDILNTEFNIKK
jgi:RimJ/RimL family protein N-acetyltransferase